jgi:hypothetical protein
MKQKMNFIRQIPILLLLSGVLACGNAKTGGENDKGKDGAGDKSNVSVELPKAVTAADLEKAKKDGKPVFLVITGTGATGVENAAAIVKDANKKAANSLTFLLNRDDAANSDIVEKLGIATVPVPFILVVSPMGNAVAGAQPEKMSADQLVKSIPSPKEDEVYVAMGEKKAVFIVVSKTDYKDKDGVIANCKTASSKLTPGASIVEFDFDDPVEKAFISQIGVTQMTGTTVTVVVNTSGQITETFTKKATVGQLNAAANKVIQKSGCGPGGCAPGKSCG